MSAETKKKYLVRITYKIVVSAVDEFNAEHEARQQIDSFTDVYDIRTTEVEEEDSP